MKPSKFAFLILAACMQTISANAKKVETNWLNPENPTQVGYITDISILKADSAAVYLITNWRERNDYPENMGFSVPPFAHLHKWNRATNEHSSIELFDLPPKEKKWRKLLFTLEVDGLHYIVSHYKGKSEKKHFIYAQSIDFEQFKINEDVRLIAEIDVPESEWINGGECWFQADTCKGKVLFNYVIEAKQNNQMGVIVMDKKLNTEWVKSSRTPIAVGKNYEFNYIVDKEGNLYAVQANYGINAKRSSNAQKTHLVFYPKDGSAPKGRLLTLNNNKEIVSQSISFNDKDELICVGLFAEKHTRSAVGAFTMTFTDQLDSIKHQHTKAFERPFFLKGESQDMQEALQKMLDQKEDFEKEFSYSSPVIHFRENGAYDFVIEKSRLGISKSDGIATYSFTFGDIIAVCCNPDGSFKWQQKIPKHQEFENAKEFLGHYYLIHDEEDNMHFIFNQFETNRLRLTDRAEPQTFMLSVDPEGNESFQTLFNDPEASKIFAPLFSKPSNDSSALVLMRFNQFKLLFTTKKHYNVIFGELKFN